jgi:nicotinic acid mononucleotide adenylyltransferase
LVSFEHRFRMCQLAFTHLNDTIHTTKVIISDAEYMSWKNAVKDMYVCTCRPFFFLLYNLPVRYAFISKLLEFSMCSSPLFLCHNSTDNNEKEKISVGTAVLLDYLSSVHPKNEFYFCLGADSFFDLIHGKWQYSQRILNELLYDHSSTFRNNNDNNNNTSNCIPKRRIVVLYRSNNKLGITNETNNTEITNVVQQEQQQSFVDDEYYNKLQKTVQEYGVQLIHMNNNNNNNNNHDTNNHSNNISSTFVRNCSDLSMLQNNSYIILPSVLEYIQQHSLYPFCAFVK